MNAPDSASAAWAALLPEHDRVLRKAERYAELTIRRLIKQDGYVPGEEQGNDAQSAGAILVNHLANKMAVAMWSPTRPNFRLEVGDETAKKLRAGGITVEDANAALSRYERRAVRSLNKGDARAKFVRLMQLLIATGNALLDLSTDTPRVLALPYYAVKRNHDGSLNTLIVKERMEFNELADNVRAACPRIYSDSALIDFYTWVRPIDGGRFEITKWVNETKLPNAFTAIKQRDSVYLHPMTWALSDEDNYGTGLVEDVEQDFESLAAVSTAVVDGAIVGCEVRWLVNPTGQTSVEDFKNSRNGDAVAGVPTDIEAKMANNLAAVQAAMSVTERWEQRLGRLFLMHTAITRDAERVTAEEVRRNALEIETTHAGAYSALSHGVQTPIASWMLRTAKIDLQNTDIDMTVITGLDALSRAGDLEALAMALDLLAKLTALPENLSGRLKMDVLTKDVGAGFGIDLSRYVMTNAEYGQTLADQGTARVAEAGATANATEQGTP